MCAYTEPPYPLAHVCGACLTGTPALHGSAGVAVLFCFSDFLMPCMLSLCGRSWQSKAGDDSHLDSRWSFSSSSGLVQRPIPVQLLVCFTYAAVKQLPALYDPGCRPISVPLLAATSLCTWSVLCFCNTSIVLGDTHYVSRLCPRTARRCVRGKQVAIPLGHCCRYVLSGVGVPLLLYFVDAVA